MRRAHFALITLAVLLVGAMFVGNWRAHRSTQRKLDALVAALAPPDSAPQPQPPAAQPPATPAGLTEPKPLPSSLVIPASGTVPREPDRISGYVIETSDVLVIEAMLRDLRSGLTERLPVQPVSGEYLVRPDGTISLGGWGSVAVAGMTAEKAMDAIRRKLAEATRVNGNAQPERIHVTLDVKSNNSKSYYVILDGGAGGEQVLRFPMTGNETVLDAIAAVNGLAAVADRRLIRVVRKGSAGAADLVLPVDWNGIVSRGETITNYILKPGDRVYVTGTR
jgi:polysaccharide export outer membrane protein